MLIPGIQRHLAGMNTNTAPATAPAASNVARLATVWADKHPELSARIQRAVALVSNVSTTLAPEIFFIEGSWGHKYIIRTDRKARTSTCTCPDSEKGHHCKHRLAVALYVAAQA